jgi:hypothetical protein
MALGFAFLAFPPATGAEVAVRFQRLEGFASPDTPAELNKVGVLQIGRKKAKNILVLNPGTSETSPSGLIAAQAHLGRLAASGDPRGWDQAGEITPILRFANMFSGTGLPGLDGTSWYHPLRLTIDSGAVAAGNENPAQSILDVRATHGHDLPKRLLIYAFGAALGGQRVLDAATVLATQSAIPPENLTLLDRHETYSHNDPNSAYPDNDFVDELVTFLAKVQMGKRR